MSADLESRFFEFARALPGASNLDDRAINGEKADLLLAVDRIVCEVKSLKTDTTAKVQAIVERWGIAPGPGRHDIFSLVADHPDAGLIGPQVYEAIFSSLEAELRKANSQIRNTKKELGLPHAAGVMVLLNDQIADLHPDLMFTGLKHKLSKQLSGSPKFPEVNLVWYISEIFPPEMPSNVKAFCGWELNPIAPTWGALTQIVRFYHDGWVSTSGYPRPAPNSRLQPT